MAEEILQLHLSRAQLEQFQAHLFVAVYCLTLQASVPSPQPTLEMVKELGSRFFALGALEQSEFSLRLSGEEVWILRYLFLVLQRRYNQSSPSEHRSLALSHLATCRLLVEQVVFPEEEYLSLTDAAHMMGVAKRTVYGYLESGKLHGLRTGASTVIAAKDVERYKRATIGRPRTRIPTWRQPVPTNLEYFTTITVCIRSGQSEKLESRLAEIRMAKKHLIPGTVARYVVRDNSDPERLQIVLVWRKLVMPSDEEREAAMAALCADLADLLRLETAVKHEGLVLMNT